VRVEGVAPYEPGRFYKRELKPVLAVLGQVPVTLRAVLVDGYVWLDTQGTPGLGAHLYRALAERVPVVGVAKQRFGDAGFAVSVLRGRSKRPLYVTAAGMPLCQAASCILRMHGQDRLPTMIRMADRLSRSRSGERDSARRVCEHDESLSQRSMSPASGVGTTPKQRQGDSRT
jgi:deoxyribonuclease V